MNRSRTVVILLAVLVVATSVAVTGYLTRDAHDPTGAGVLRAPEALSPDAQPAEARLPGADAARPAAELAAAELPHVHADDEAAAIAALPARSVRGIARMHDGSPLPEGLAVHAQLERPAPELNTLRGSIGSASEGFSSEKWHLEREHSEAFAALPQTTRVVVDADGRFELPDVPEHELWVAVDDALLYLDPAVSLPAEVDAVTLVIVRGARITGRVTQGAGADVGVPHAEVQFATEFDPLAIFETTTRMLSMEATCDADGRYVLERVPAGLRLVTMASSSDGNLQPVQSKLDALAPGEQRVLDLQLPAGNVVTGRVTQADGTPLADADLHLMKLDMDMKNMSAMIMSASSSRDDATSDDDGSFRFEGVPDGRYEVMLVEDGWRQVRSGKLSLKGGETLSDVDLVADAGLSIAGRVQDEAGEPVEGARIKGGNPPSFTDARANMGSAYRESVTTDADGAFLLRGFDDDEQQLRVSAEGFATVKQRARPGETDVLVTLSALASVSGIVVSLVDGEPVPDFTLSFIPEGGLFDLTDMANMEQRMEGMVASRRFRDREDGTFTLEHASRGVFDLTVTGAGFGATVIRGVKVGAEGARGLVVMLPPESRLTGTVVSGRDGRPLPGAVVSTSKRGLLNVMTASLVGDGPEATADDEGRFELAGLSGNTAVNLTVRHPTHRELAVPELVLAPGESRDVGPLRLSAGAAIFGRVLDGEGKPVPDTTVMASTATGSSIRRGSSDAEGRYRIEGLAPGSYTVMRMDFSMSLGDANPAGYMQDMVMRIVSLAEDEVLEVDLVAKGAGGTRLAGRIASASGPVPGAMLTLMPAQGGMSGMQFAGCNEAGDYEFPGVAPGNYVLQVTVLDETNASTGAQATGAVSDQLTIGGLPEQRHDVLLPGGELHGTVENALDGARIGGVRIVLERTDAGRPDFGLAAAMGGRVGETYADATGAFRFRFLPAGSYAIVAGGRNVIGMGAKGWAMTRVPDLSVAASGPGFSVRVKLRPAGSIEGTVRSTGGAELAGVGIWVADASGAWQSTFSEQASGENGEYAVDSLEEGNWTLAFQGGEHALKLVPGVQVREGDVTRLDVSLAKGVPLQLLTGGHAPGSLQVSLVGPEGPLPTGLVALSEVMHSTDAGAAMKLGTYPPGAYHLTVMSGAFRLLDTSVTLTSGKTETVSLEQ